VESDDWHDKTYASLTDSIVTIYILYNTIRLTPTVHSSRYLLQEASKHIEDCTNHKDLLESSRRESALHEIQKRKLFFAKNRVNLTMMKARVNRRRSD
jgi:hypothetical protein